MNFAEKISAKCVELLNFKILLKYWIMMLHPSQQLQMLFRNNVSLCVYGSHDLFFGVREQGVIVSHTCDSYSHCRTTGSNARPTRSGRRVLATALPSRHFQLFSEPLSLWRGSLALFPSKQKKHYKSHICWRTRRTSLESEIRVYKYHDRFAHTLQ